MFRRELGDSGRTGERGLRSPYRDMNVNKIDERLSIRIGLTFDGLPFLVRKRKRD